MFIDTFWYKITSPTKSNRTVETQDQSVMVTLIDNKPTVSEEERQRFLAEEKDLRRQI